MQSLRQGGKGTHMYISTHVDVCPSDLTNSFSAHWPISFKRGVELSDIQVLESFMRAGCRAQKSVSTETEAACRLRRQ